MSSDPAFGRWLIIQCVRLSGVALVLIGVLGMTGAISMQPLVAFLIASVGLIDAAILPIFLARKWKTPNP